MTARGDIPRNFNVQTTRVKSSEYCVQAVFGDAREVSYEGIHLCMYSSDLLYSDQRWDVMPSLGLCGISDYLHTLHVHMVSVRSMFHLCL